MEHVSVESLCTQLAALSCLIGFRSHLKSRSPQLGGLLLPELQKPLLVLRLLPPQLLLQLLGDPLALLQVAALRLNHVLSGRQRLTGQKGLVAQRQSDLLSLLSRRLSEGGQEQLHAVSIPYEHRDK